MCSRNACWKFLYFTDESHGNGGYLSFRAIMNKQCVHSFHFSGTHKKRNKNKNWTDVQTGFLNFPGVAALAFSSLVQRVCQGAQIRCTKHHPRVSASLQHQHQHQHQHQRQPHAGVNLRPALSYFSDARSYRSRIALFSRSLRDGDNATEHTASADANTHCCILHR